MRGERKTRARAAREMRAVERECGEQNPAHTWDTRVERAVRDKYVGGSEAEGMRRDAKRYKASVPKDGWDHEKLQGYAYNGCVCMGRRVGVNASKL